MGAGLAVLFLRGPLGWGGVRSQTFDNWGLEPVPTKAAVWLLYLLWAILGEARRVGPV